MNRNSLFALDNLVFSYEGGDPVLLIESLELEKGGITSFRGLNGSGKTTLLKLLAGVLDPPPGKIRSNDPGRIVLVDQEPYLFQGTVNQNLLYALKFRQTSHGSRQRKIAEALEVVGLSGFEKRKARQLSGGEKKRLAIARALVTDPSVLLLDEPDANVDAATSKALESLFIKLKERGLSLIIATHNNSLAYRLSDRIIELEDGGPVSSFENILRGSYELHDGTFSRFRTNGGEILCPSRKGDYKTAVLSPIDIFLSKDRMEKEDYNQLKGTLTSLTPVPGDGCILTIDCGIIIHSQISSTASDLLEFEKGEELFVLFAPSAVHLY